MTKETKNFSRADKYFTGLLILIFIIILIGVYFLTYPVLKNTQLYRVVKHAYQEKVWVTFRSERAKFSFKHPISWPVSVVDFEVNNGMYKYLADDGIIEYVNFEEEFNNQAGGSSLGFIIVEKPKYGDLKEYVNDYGKEQTFDMYVKGRIQTVTIKPPKIEYLKIGGVDAISVTGTNAFASFSNGMADYLLIENDWSYRFVTTDSSRFLENKEKNSKTFQKIVSSVKFFD